VSSAELLNFSSISLARQKSLQPDLLRDMLLLVSVIQVAISFLVIASISIDG
jgi:hypothetical protein